jgi:DeoR/GlpR family transcriptional regulator of sugar metabolism
LSREQSQKIPAQRRVELLALLKERGAASISDLSVALQASESTVRRDLDQLDAEGLVRRTHGGAIITGLTGRPSSLCSPTAAGTIPKKKRGLDG